MLQPGERFLDVGCGWGALVLRAAKEIRRPGHGRHAQPKPVRIRVAADSEEGLQGRCEVHLQDYRDYPGEGVFDKIASVGMFEHVGLRHLKVYFTKIRTLLAEGGWS